MGKVHKHDQLTADREEADTTAHRLPRSHRIMLAVLLLTIVIAQGVGPGALGLTHRASVPKHNNAFLAAIASKIAGREQFVTCRLKVTKPGTLGVSSDGVIHLTKDICQDMRTAKTWTAAERACIVIDQDLSRRACFPRVNFGIRAMQILAHEALHGAGVSDEHITDCYALQKIYFVAQSIGIDAPLARAASRYYVSHYNLARQPTKDCILPSACRNGGALDLNPDSDDWPN